MLLILRPAVLTGLIGSLAISLTSCANTPTGEALQRSVAADPALKDGSGTFGTPSPSNSPQPNAVKIPADFPSDIPIYPEAQLQSAQSGEARWTTADPSNLVQNFYQKAFQSNNWEIVNQPAETAGSNAPTNTLVARKNNLRVTVSIQTGLVPDATATGTTQVAIQYNRDSGESAIAPDLARPSDFPSPTNTQSPALPTASEPTTSPTSSAGTSAFTDINKAPQELRPYIADLAALGVLNINATGSKSNSATSAVLFEPNKPISRREYARWLVAANNQIHANNPGKLIRLASATSQPAFQDVPRTDPDFAAIQGLAEAGLIPSPLTGDAIAVLFRPGNQLTRENLILWKVPLDTRQNLPNASVDAVKQTWGFQDAGKIEPKALRAVLVDFQNAESSNIRRLLGYTTLFQPKKPVTRAEAAAVLWYFGSQGEGVSAKEALQLQRQPSQPSPTPEVTPSPSPSQ